MSYPVAAGDGGWAPAPPRHSVVPRLTGTTIPLQYFYQGSQGQSTHDDTRHANMDYQAVVGTTLQDSASPAQNFKKKKKPITTREQMAVRSVFRKHPTDHFLHIKQRLIQEEGCDKIFHITNIIIIITNYYNIPYYLG